jgi:hypothetical protein
MKKPETRNILVSVPVPILKKLESSARSQMRSRTAEICVRLEQSLKPVRPILDRQSQSAK